MRRLIAVILAMIFLAPAVLAIDSYIVSDPYKKQGDNSLKVEADDGESLEYDVSLEPGFYSLSFLYRVQSGSFSYTIDGITTDVLPKPLSSSAYSFESFSFELEDPAAITVRFTGVDDGSVFFLDALTLEPSKAPTVYYEDGELNGFNDFQYTTGCCPADFCYTGDFKTDLPPPVPSCIHDDYFEKDVTTPPLGWTLSEFGGGSKAIQLLNARGGYRCIDGEWKYSPIKFTPTMDEAAFCPDDMQCFIGTKGGTVVDSAEVCVEHNTFHNYAVKKMGPDEQQSFYCYEGNWTTRTKEIALQLLNMTDGRTKFTLFCDTYERSLNPDSTLFTYRDFFGESIMDALETRTVNEFCVLDLDGRIIAGTSLNFAINESQASCDAEVDDCTLLPVTSFMHKLKGVDDYCDDLPDDGLYHACQGRDVFYNPQLQNVIFTRPYGATPQEVPMNIEVSFIGRVWQGLKDIVSYMLRVAGVTQAISPEIAAGEFDFIKNAGSFNRVYISFDPTGVLPKEIKGIVESRANVVANQIITKTFMTVDYLNYRVPVCKYFYQHNLPHLQNQISFEGPSGIRCTPIILDDDNWKYSVYVEEPRFKQTPLSETDRLAWSLHSADVFWNDMTAKIRSRSVSASGGSPPTTPVFTVPERVVQNWPAEFFMEDPGDDIIAVTWDFGDGRYASSEYNISAPHTYREARTEPYPVSVRVMNRDYLIAKSAVVDVPVGSGPAVSIISLPQEADRTAAIQLEFNDQTFAPVSVLVDWNDSSKSSVANYALQSDLILTHTYDFPSGKSRMPYRIVVRGSTSDAPFTSAADLIIERDAGTQLQLAVNVLRQEEPTVARLNISINESLRSVIIDWRDYLNESYAGPVTYDNPDPSEKWMLVEYGYNITEPLATDILVTARSQAKSATASIALTVDSE